MISIKFQYQAISDALDQASARLTDLKPLYDDIGEYMIEATKERFKKGIDPDGNAWMPKSPATLAAYEARGDGVRPDPLIGASKRLSTEISKFVADSSVEIGSSLEYSGVMQNGAKKGAFGTNSRGSPIPWGDIPARVWLGISAEDEENIIDIADEHLQEAFDSRGFNLPL